jgi:ketosteroid isomerase-like protein
MRTNLFFPLALCVLIVACNTSKPDLKAEEATIRKLDSTWAAQAKSGTDVEKIVSYWSDDAVVIAPGQPVVKGKEALRKFVEDSKAIPGFSITWRGSDIQFSPDGQVAYLSGQNLMTMNNAEGTLISVPGRGYTIWRKQADGGWKCVVDIWNNQ